MIFFFGSRRLGTVFAVGNARVETEFFCVNFLPLFPVRSRFCVTGDGGADEAELDHPIPLVRASVIAGFARAWGLVLGLGLLAHAVLGRDGVAHGSLLLGVVLLAITTWAWTSLGAPSADDVARLRVYQSFTTYPVDPTLFDEDVASELRARLATVMKERVPMLGAGTYREMPDAREFEAIARHPDVRDPEFLRAAMTLARVTRDDALHDAIWEKLKKLG